MSRLDEGYTGLARFSGRPETGEFRGIVIKSQRAAPNAPRRLAAAMSAAMMKGNVEAVAAALCLLGARPSRQAMGSPLTFGDGSG
jgi:hypothetical protein